MRDQFNWQVEEETKEPATQATKSRWTTGRILFWVAALAITIALIAWWGTTRREQHKDREELVETAQEVLDMGQQAVVDGDGELFFSLQDGDADWVMAQLLPENQIAYRNGYTVTNAEQHGDIIWANVSWEQQGKAYQRIQFFHWREGQLRQVPTDPLYWGNRLRGDDEWGKLEYPAVDDPWAASIQNYVQNTVTELCADDCLSEYLPLTLEVRGDYRETAEPGRITIPSPRLLGLNASGKPSSRFWEELDQRLQAHLTAAGSTSTMAVDAAQEPPAYWPTEGWRVSTPEEQGMDSEKLAEMFTHIQQEEYDIHSVTIIRNGYLVADAAVDPFPANSTHIVQSVAKSIVSALIGIAIEQGAIESVQQPVLSFFPGRTAANFDAHKEAMTLEHLLMMASGLECRDSYLYNWQGLNQMMQTDDWVQFMLDLPMADEPGTRFEYCNGASFLLSAIIQETTGMNAAAFADAHLFAPLGIMDVVWSANPQGITFGWGALRMRPHDMAKIGYLYLNEGRWDGEQIIPAGWVAASTRQHIATLLYDGYGYQWWIEDEGYYLALGYKGQFIYVVPDQELVVAFTGDLNEDDFDDPETLLIYFIIPAVESSTALPANPDGVARMQALIQEVAAEPEVITRPVPPSPAIAEQVLGEMYILENNVLGWHSFSLVPQGGDEMLLRLTFDEVYLPSEAEYRLGLDGVQRVATGAYGVLAAGRGFWEDENTFVAKVDEPGDLLSWRLAMDFQDDNVTVWFTGSFRNTYAMQGKREGSQ